MTIASATAFHRGKLLGENELLPPASTCPICGLPGKRKPVTWLQRSPDVLFLRCPTCSGISASRMPTDAAISDYYTHYYDRVLTELVTTPQPQRLAWRIADCWTATVRRKHISILDFGGGDGTISTLVAERLIASSAVDCVEILVVDHVTGGTRQLPANIDLRFATDLQAVEGKYDIVIASAILEHIPLFRPALDGLLARATSGALFYARTPYMTPFAKLISIDLTFPGHVHDLGAATWAWLSQNCGFDVTVLKHRPSIVETVLQSHALRTITAHILKAPARILAALNLPPVWPYYGGWEVVWRIGITEVEGS